MTQNARHFRNIFDIYDNVCVKARHDDERFALALPMTRVLRNLSPSRLRPMSGASDSAQPRTRAQKGTACDRKFLKAIRAFPSTLLRELEDVELSITRT